jgi:apolipoprotein N-acyltransferase
VVNIQEGLFRNEATVIDPQGQFLGVFGKDHPVVFGGETSPARHLPRL